MLNIITTTDLIRSLITGIISSAVFLVLLYNLKPKFSISDVICCEKTNIDGVVADYYYFKILTKSLFFKVYDVKVRAYVCTAVKNINANDIQRNEVKIPYNSQTILPRFNPRHYFQDFFNGDKALKTRTDYAAQFFTDRDLKYELSNGSKYVEFQVIAKHSLTGFSTVKTMHYSHVFKIKDGKFLSGNSFKILHANEPITILIT